MGLLDKANKREKQLGLSSKVKGNKQDLSVISKSISYSNPVSDNSKTSNIMSPGAAKSPPVPSPPVNKSLFDSIPSPPIFPPKFEPAKSERKGFFSFLRKDPKPSIIAPSSQVVKPVAPQAVIPSSNPVVSQIVNQKGSDKAAISQPPTPPPKVKDSPLVPVLPIKSSSLVATSTIKPTSGVSFQGKNQIPDRPVIPKSAVPRTTIPIPSPPTAPKAQRNVPGKTPIYESAGLLAEPMHIHARKLDEDVIREFLTSETESQKQFQVLKNKEVHVENRLAAVREREKALLRELDNVNNLRRRHDHDVRERLQHLRNKEAEITIKEKEINLQDSFLKTKDSFEKRLMELKKTESVLRAKEEALQKRESELRRLTTEKEQELIQLHEEIRVGNIALKQQEKDWQENLKAQREQAQNILKEDESKRLRVLAEKESLVQIKSKMLSENESLIQKKLDENKKLEEYWSEKQREWVKFGSIEAFEKSLEKRKADLDLRENDINKKFQTYNELYSKLQSSLAEVKAKEDRIRNVKELKTNTLFLEDQYQSLKSEVELRSSLDSEIKKVKAKERELDKQLAVVLELQKDRRHYRSSKYDVEDLSIEDGLSVNGGVSSFHDDEVFFSSDLKSPSDAMENFLNQIKDALSNKDLAMAKALFNQARLRFYDLPLSKSEHEHYHNILRLLYDNINLASLQSGSGGKG